MPPDEIEEVRSSLQLTPNQDPAPVNTPAPAPDARAGSIWQEFHDVFLAATEPAAYADDWAFLARSCDVRAALGGPAQLLTTLRGRLSDASLMGAGIIVVGADGQPALTPVIGTAAPMMLRRDAQGRVVDVVSDAGSLRRKTPPSYDPTTVQSSVAQTISGVGQ
ncbi:MAG TPA: hypothetical protein VH107_00295 [Lacipirellulaceae bacterium]|nr:hypothetical protein [Lacipirellulaceae bacterium]